jgi:hypothetical protein
MHSAVSIFKRTPEKKEEYHKKLEKSADGSFQQANETLAQMKEEDKPSTDLLTLIA